jgi:hypothetical protein
MTDKYQTQLKIIEEVDGLITDIVGDLKSAEIWDNRIWEPINMLRARLLARRARIDQIIALESTYDDDPPF